MIGKIGVGFLIFFSSYLLPASSQTSVFVSEADIVALRRKNKTKQNDVDRQTCVPHI